LAGFTISPQDIARLEANPQLFKNYGGTKGVSTCLRINPQEGIQGTPEDIQLRVDAFGTNTYIEREPKVFLVRKISFLNCVKLIFIMLIWMLENVGLHVVASYFVVHCTTCFFHLMTLVHLDHVLHSSIPLRFICCMS
jgi:hypothetical protein